MYATIKLSPYIHIQGRVTRTLPSGAIAVEFGGREFVGPAVVATEVDRPKLHIQG